MGDGIGGIVALVFTVIILGILDVDAFWPLLAATMGGWAVPMMAVILIVEGAGIYGELEALG
ncbi:MAG: hypothetical protein ABSB53_03660 [Nitrososphaerales archaeon]